LRAGNCRATSDARPRDQEETQFPAHVSTPARARAFLRGALQTWQLDGFGAVTELLTDELVSNVVRHVGAPMTVRALRSPTRIRVEVDDPSTRPPVQRYPNPFDSTGRGLLLVEDLADRWGTDVRNDGKTVWFELDVRSPD
jgi:anti-sigma regulatory factor (Ser/Thr protein kinase)